jgi:hypothetical protein
MSSEAAFETVRDYLIANWTTTPLVFENEEYQTADNPTAFVFVEIWGDFFDQASIGSGSRDSNLWREEGALHLHVMTPNGSGSTVARTYATTLVGLFRGLDIGRLTFREASIGAGDPGRQFANYYAMTCTIAWRRDQ